MIRGFVGYHSYGLYGVYIQNTCSCSGTCGGSKVLGEVYLESGYPDQGKRSFRIPGYQYRGDPALIFTRKGYYAVPASDWLCCVFGRASRSMAIIPIVLDQSTYNNSGVRIPYSAYYIRTHATLPVRCCGRPVVARIVLTARLRGRSSSLLWSQSLSTCVQGCISCPF